MIVSVMSRLRSNSLSTSGRRRGSTSAFEGREEPHPVSLEQFFGQGSRQISFVGEQFSEETLGNVGNQFAMGAILP